MKAEKIKNASGKLVEVTQESQPIAKAWLWEFETKSGKTLKAVAKLDYRGPWFEVLTATGRAYVDLLDKEIYWIE